MCANEGKDSALSFLLAAVAHYEALSVKIERLIINSGSAYRFQLFAETWHQAHFHSTLPPPDQLQGRAIHPNLSARMGLCTYLSQQR